MTLVETLTSIVQRLGRPRAAALALDFGQPQQRPRMAGMLACSLGALLLALVMWQSELAHERVAEQESELASLGVKRDAQQQRQARGAGSGVDLEDRVRRANRVIRQLSTPWEDVFKAIESTTGGNVTMLSLESDPVSAEVRAAAEARNTTAMIDYLERLRSDGRLSPAILLSHQVMIEDPSRPIRFTFSASWISAKHAQN